MPRKMCVEKKQSSPQIVTELPQTIYFATLVVLNFILVSVLAKHWRTVALRSILSSLVWYLNCSFLLAKWIATLTSLFTYIHVIDKSVRTHQQSCRRWILGWCRFPAAWTLPARTRDCWSRWSGCSPACQGINVKMRYKRAFKENYRCSWHWLFYLPLIRGKP